MAEEICPDEEWQKSGSFFDQAKTRAKAASRNGLTDKDALLFGWQPFVENELLPAVFTLRRMGMPLDTTAIVSSLLADDRYAEFRDPEMYVLLIGLVSPVVDAFAEVRL